MKVTVTVKITVMYVQQCAVVVGNIGRQTENFVTTRAIMLMPKKSVMPNYR